MQFKGIQKRKILSFNWRKFILHLKKLIAFHSLNSIVPINADRWEELINATLNFMGKKPIWNQGSHSKGADIWTKDFSISAKSGNIKGNMLILSSYRLTRFNSIDEMKEFIDGDGKNFDIYLCCSRIDTKTERIYKIFLIGADIILANSMQWLNAYSRKNKGVHSGWRGRNKEGVILDIVRKMSNQLWMNIPINLCNEILEVKISNNKLGSKIEEPLKN